MQRDDSQAIHWRMVGLLAGALLPGALVGLEQIVRSTVPPSFPVEALAAFPPAYLAGCIAERVVRRRRWRQHDPLGVVPKEIRDGLGIQRGITALGDDDGTLQGWPEGYLALLWRPEFESITRRTKHSSSRATRAYPLIPRATLAAALGDYSRRDWLWFKRFMWYKRTQNNVHEEISGFAYGLAIRAAALDSDPARRLEQLRGLRALVLMTLTAEGMDSCAWIS